MDFDPRRARDLLRLGTGDAAADFRTGQLEAVRHVVTGAGRLLVVRKTGWGKSFVYFIATRLLREAGMGPALLVSPLLSLMRNRILTGPVLLVDDMVDSRWTFTVAAWELRRKGCEAVWPLALADAGTR